MEVLRSISKRLWISPTDVGALDVVSVVTVTPFNLVSVVAVTSFKGLKSEDPITKKKSRIQNCRKSNRILER